MENTPDQPNLTTIINQLSHDISSPLCSLRMIVHSCTDLSKRQKNALIAVCDRISDIANSMLKYTKPEYYNEAQFNKQNTVKPTNITTDIMEIITEKRYEYAFRDIKFTPKLNVNSNVYINVDSHAFKRSISNIINNAVDAIGEVEDRAGEVIVTIDTTNNQVKIAIQDNGKGMPEFVCEEILNHIPVTFGKANGHGIGYMQIHDMLAKSNGELHMQSKQDVGTKVMLTFPKLILSKSE